MPKRVISSGFW